MEGTDSFFLALPQVPFFLMELYHFQTSFAVFSEHPESVSKRLKLRSVTFTCKHLSEYLVLIYNNNLCSALNNISKNEIKAPFRFQLQVA